VFRDNAVTAHPRTVSVVDRAGAARATVQWGLAGTPAIEGDWYALLVACEALRSRMRTRLEHELAITDSVWVAASAARGGTWVTISANAETKDGARLLRELATQLTDLGAITDEDATIARDRLLAQHAGSFERAEDIASELAWAQLHGAVEDRFGRYGTGIRAVEPAAVRALARRLLAPTTGAIVILGDWSALRESIVALGWGSFALRDDEGRLVMRYPK
jgi:predicted Zn-dependent peptidase